MVCKDKLCINKVTISIVEKKKQEGKAATLGATPIHFKVSYFVSSIYLTSFRFKLEQITCVLNKVLTKFHFHNGSHCALTKGKKAWIGYMSYTSFQE